MEETGRGCGGSPGGSGPERGGPEEGGLVWKKKFGGAPVGGGDS
jgi:hypothetical protein